jgi:hypothetical protein
MATEDRIEVSKRGGGRYLMSRVVDLTMTNGVQVQDLSITEIPEGARIRTMSGLIPAAFSGAPTNINLTIGKGTTPGDTTYVNATDVKSPLGPNFNINTSAYADLLSWPANQGLNMTLTAVGGTNPSGTIRVEVIYCPPNHA